MSCRPQYCYRVPASHNDCNNFPTFSAETRFAMQTKCILGIILLFEHKTPPYKWPQIFVVGFAILLLLVLIL